MTQVFISYARDDNVPPPDEGDARGFVDWLYAQVQWRLSQFPQPRPDVWRDTRQVEPGEQFSKEIADALAASAILVVVLSPIWLQREWCLHELELFERAHSDLNVNELRERIVCVVKSHVAPELRPKSMQGQVGYQFYTLSNDNDQEIELFRGRPLEGKCTQLADGLTRHLYHLMRTISSSRDRTNDRHIVEDSGSVRDGVYSISAPHHTSPAKIQRRKIFVAWPASDMENAYRTVVRELTGHGFAVEPEPLPAADRISHLLNRSEAEAFIDNALQEVELSIHLLGDQKGFAPEDAPPIAELQLLRAALRISSRLTNTDVEDKAFQRLIWAPKSLAGGNQQDRDPLAILKSIDLEALRAGDKVEGDVLPKFVQFIIDRLDSRCVVEPGPPATDIYLRYQDGEDDDLRLAVAVAKELRRAGLNADVTPIDPDARREAFHRKRLRECDAILFCWKQASDTWVRESTVDLLQWKQLGRHNPFRRNGVLVAPPPKASKDMYKELKPDAVNMLEISGPPLSSDAVTALVQFLTTPRS